MKKVLLPLLFLTGLLATIGCRSDFERVRISNNPQLILETADSLYASEEYNRAITLYELIVPAYRGKREAEHIALRLASSNYYSGRYILSSHYFKAFADTYAASDNKEEAMFLSAISYYRLSPRYQLDQTESERAIDAFQAFANSYPDSDRVAECNRYIDELRQKMEEKAYNSGKLYYKRGDYSSAIASLENLLKDFPDTDFSEDARFIIVQASIDWADRSIYSKKEERYSKALERCNNYLKRHAENERSESINKTKDQCDQELKILQNG